MARTSRPARPTTPAEIRWHRISGMYRNAWTLTDPRTDGRTEQQYAMDQEHAAALTAYAFCEPEAYRDHVARTAHAIAAEFIDLAVCVVATDPFSRKA